MFRGGIALVVALCRVVPTGGAQTPDIVSGEDFARYEYPGECARASVWYENMFWRDKRRDTVSWPNREKRPQRATIAAVERCLAPFDQRPVLPRDLLGLGEAYLAAEQWRRADSVFDDLLDRNASRSLRDRAWLLSQIVKLNALASHAHLEIINRYLGQLSALGKPAAVERMLAQLSVAQLAHLRDDTTLWKSAITAALSASREIEGELRNDYAIESAIVYGELVLLQARLNRPDLAFAAIDSGSQALVPRRPSVLRRFDAIRQWVKFQGQAAMPLQATWWFNPDSTQETRPVAGRPAMFVFASHACGSRCFVGYSVLRRLALKYVGALDVTVVTRTQGFYRNALSDPTNEAQQIREYFLDELKLPVSVAVWQTVTGKRADGRIFVISAPNEQAYDNPSYTDLVTIVVDRSGKVRLSISANLYNEAVLDDVLREVVGTSSASIIETASASTHIRSDSGLTLEWARKIAAMSVRIDSVLRGHDRLMDETLTGRSNMDAAQKLSVVLSIAPRFRTLMTQSGIPPEMYIKGYTRISMAWRAVIRNRSLSSNGQALLTPPTRDMQFVEQYLDQLVRMAFPKPGLY